MSASTSKGVLPLVLLVALLVALALSISSAGPASASPDGPTPHDPIHIVGDDNFTPANGVTSGSGTADDPYIIEDWAIDASGKNGIKIQNTTAYFVIRNCLVENSGDYYYGIYLENVINGKVENNTCSNNYTSIYLGGSSSNTLSNNTCSNSPFNIYLLNSSDYNTLSNNTCSNNYWWWWRGKWFGIYLYSSSYNTLDNNTLSNNHFGVSGDEISHFDHDIDTSNLVDGRPIYYLKDNSDIVIGPSLNVGYLGFVRCDNIRVENLVLEKKDQGILLVSIENSRIENCTFLNNVKGIHMYFSSNNTLSNNTCENNDIGILLYSSSNNTPSNNTCENNYYCGIYLYSSSNNTPSNNTCENNKYGIFLYSSSSNTLSNNTCENNYSEWGGAGIGIFLVSSSNYNNLTNNTCENNDTGIYLESSSSNTIFHNYLLNNTENNAYDNGANYWDNGSEGNYWSDWQPPDHPDADGDGIVDEPRPIAGGINQDDYPLVLGMEVEEAPEIPYMLYAGVISIVIIITVGIVTYRRH